MQIQENGVGSASVRYFFTPSSAAERVLLFPTRLGHYFCDRRYNFSSVSTIAKQASHKLHYMIMLINRGSMAFEIEENEYIASKGQIVLFDCKKSHRYEAQTDDLEFYWLVCNGLMLSELYTESLSVHGGKHVFSIAEYGDALTAMLQLLHIGAAGYPVDEHRLSEIIYGLLMALLTVEREQSDEMAVLLKRSRLYMDNRFAANISVDEVAAYIGLSTSYFTKRFREYTGYSPYEYLTLRRVSRAKELLIGSSSSVKQIAFASGYNSEENFIRVFKKKTGLSPGMFRRFPV